ncbi:putative Zn(II)2Cys6 transcription factor [Ustulina deusta]|nr:putative Zn(II)2Cys6 transcription factor [Ustulina deusta]
MDSPMNDDYGGMWSRPANAAAPESSARATKRRRMDVNGDPTRERGVMRDGNEPGLPRFIGSGRGIHLIRTVYDALARSHIDPSRNRRDAAADVVPGEEDQLTGPSPSDPRTPGGSSSVNFDNLLQWTEGYFKYWHPIFPFLHGPAFLGVLEQVGDNGIEALNQADAIIVRSVLSISLADFRHPFPPNLVFLNQDDVAASPTFVLSNPASINNIQAALCVELFLVSMLNFNMASRVGGIIVRMSFNLGPSRFSNFSAHDAAVSLGVKDDDIDVCLPSEELHGPGRDSQSNDTALQGQWHEHEQLQLLAMLNKSIRFRREDSERALRVHAELKRWTNEVYDLTSIHPQSQSSPAEDPGGRGPDTPEGCMHPSHRILLVILQHELILSLYRPLLVSDLGTLSSQAAFQECINASRAIIDTAADNSRDFGGKEPKLKNGHLFWPSLTWSIWMSCFVLTYAVIKGITTAVSAKRQVHPSAQGCRSYIIRC